jgi:REP element-mobilizing transposase RayT
LSQLNIARTLFYEQVDCLLKEVCLEIEKRYEIKFLESGVARDHVHFLVETTVRATRAKPEQKKPTPLALR